MKNFLSKQDCLELRKRHKIERDKRICDRIKAVLLRNQGYGYAKIADILLLDTETIRRHIKEYQELKKLETLNGGSQSKLSDADSHELRKHLTEKTYLYVKNICEYVKNRFGCKYSLSGMTKWLHANGFCHKKPHAVPAKADKARQEAFLKYYESLKEAAGDQEPIYFADSVHPAHQTQLVYGWIKKGERKSIATTARQRRVNIMGGLSLNGHKLVYDTSDKINSESIKRFLLKLRQKNSSKKTVHLILDNASYHRSAEVKEYAKDLSIKLHYLPPYSPNLNPIERLWKIMREKVTYNTYYEKFSDFTEAIFGFFKTIARKKLLLRSRITDNFQKIAEPNFAS